MKITTIRIEKSGNNTVVFPFEDDTDEITIVAPDGVVETRVLVRWDSKWATPEQAIRFGEALIESARIAKEQRSQ